MEFNIKGSVTEDDVPPQGEHRRSIYDPVAKSAKTLEIDEGIEIEVEKEHATQQIRRILKKRLPRRYFKVTGRRRPHGYRVYIIRKS